MALNDLNKKRRFAGGTSRVQTEDVGVKPVTRIGASGDGKNIITQKSVQTGGAGDGVKRVRGASTTSFNQPRNDGGTLDKFRSSAEFFKSDDPTKSNRQLREERKTTGGRGVVPTSSDKQISGGTTRPVVSANKKASSLGNFTDQGEFTKNGKKVGAQRGSGASPFSEQGINELFGSAADLAKLFSSKEFQNRKASGIRSAAGVKGRRADSKAKSDQITALSGVLEDLSASGGDNEGLVGSIQSKIQSLISGDDGGGITSGTVGRLAEKFDDNQIKTILGIIR